MVATETVGPFDGTPWAQDQWYRYAATWAPSGVLDAAQATPSAGALGLTFNGLTPAVAAGRAWVRGAGYELAGGSKTLSAVAANTNTSLSRIDRLVLRRDLAAKTVGLVMIPGTPASSPAAPALIQSDTGQWDVPLFSFTVPPNSGTAITGITDERRFLSPDGAGRSSLAYSGSPYLGGPVSGASNLLASVAVADPGFPYRLHIDATQFALVSPGSSWNLTARLDTASGALVLPVGSGTSTSYAQVSIVGGLSPVLTGAHTVLFAAEKISGANGDGYQVNPVANLQSYRVQVVPA